MAFEQITADAHNERGVEAALAGADGAVNAISLYVECGTDTFHSVHVEVAGKITRGARQAGIKRFVHISGIGANTASPSTYIRGRGEGEVAVQTAFPGAVAAASHKFCDRATNHILSTNWPARASTPTRSCCELLSVSQDCGRC